MKDTQKLGFGALTAVVFGMMVGSGIFNLPQNMAVGAGPLAVGISWIITAAGMLLLVATFKILADARPELDAGIYQYAQHGVGHYTGFCIAWGYWLSMAFANVAYAVMLNDSFGAFWPVLHEHGWPTLVFGSLLVWVMFFIVSAGVKTAHTINSALAVLKVVALALVVVLFVIGIKADVFTFNFSQSVVDGAGLWQQVRSTMLVTLWCFIGIEGAVMLAARAKRPSDVGKATVTGFLIAWVLYVLVSMLCYGAMSRAQLAGLHDPSVAYALRYVFGEWAYWAVIVSVIVSLLGVWVAWTIVCAEVPREAARCGIFPKSFLRCNRHGIPVQGLLLSSIAMEAFMVMVMFANDVYLTTLSITGMMVLPAYLFSGIYLWRESISGRDMHFANAGQRRRACIVGILCTAYCCWLMYAGGWELLVFTSWFYLAGAGLYIKARRQQLGRGNLNHSLSDKITFAVLVLAALASVILLACGVTPF